MYTSIQFFTATCLNWQPLLREDDRKNIIINSLQHLVINNKIWVYGFTIMPNHIHVLWSKRPEYEDKNIDHSFMKFTAQSLRFYLLDTGNVAELEQYKSTQADRQYQFWERRPWKAFMADRDMCLQKLDYIHNNAVKAGLCEQAEDYVYSSARFYKEGDIRWSFLTHCLDHLY